MRELYTRAIQYHTFLKYGITIRSSDDLSVLSKYNFEKRTCSQENPECLSKFDHPIYVEPAEGIGILVVQSGSDQDAFLFARPVQINAGVAFAILPYACEFSYFIYWNGPEESVPFKVEDFLAQTELKLHIDHIYTFLYSEKSSKYVFKGEKHPFWELMYVDGGMVRVTVEGQTYILKQGDIIFYHPNEFHSIRALGNNPISYLNIAFSFVSTEEILGEHMYTINADIKRYLQKMIEEVASTTKYSVDLVAAYLKLVILQIDRLKNYPIKMMGVSSNFTLSERELWIQRICDFVDENICLPELSVAYIAKQMHISTTYLYRVFTDVKKQNLQSYIANRKLEMAKKLLGSKDYNITEISEMLNFCSPTYFATKFKELYGYTPREYARSILSK